ncbi:PREDICTED: LOW QUALITY PROTEIN: protein arginine N-methyltransferase 1.6 [Erythranthe guttata]|uniref:LOW QUALITY PROTEIN: protein arginine N-methyltransferase 1.6 n=1 Tax=Erythranthe guttata TaxID=4155 RepID=UPI00064D9BBD|nr:PREDICTED: LOW QUALITY PROTEIN: protein arginine N-methyltransferase 1.6 [Erythranthe guttata]|eukprot:XP_012843079.1 PREDICTED: LOW QUALITY PROTEIN: protein arginine N-methyltransferase 1.6 [Erythranthe guttata]
MLSGILKPLLFTFPRRPAAAVTTVRTMSSSGESTQRMFQLKTDPLTGKSEWVVIEEDEEEKTTPKALLATTSYLDMLNDTRRNRAYRHAIDNAVTKPCHVLDIGAGTGLLSMMAARAMGLTDRKCDSSCSNGKVTACESYLPMVKLMRKVLRSNGMDGKIRLLNKRSDELEVGSDVHSRADILISEILDSELLGEGLIPTLQHAHDNLLVENPLTVPYRATTYGQLVGCTYLRDMHDLVNREAELSDGIRLVPSGMAGILGVKKQQQFAMHCDALKEEIKLLSEPFKVFDFDFWRRPDSSSETEMHIKTTNDGTVYAIISWWLLQLDSEGTIFYSTEPNWIRCPDDVRELESSSNSSDNWCDHWKQSVWFPQSVDLHVLKDGEVHLHALHTETSISYDFKTLNKKQQVAHVDACTDDFQIVLSPERNALYGDSSWRFLMLNAIEKALRQRTDPLCLVADDSIFLAIAIARLSKSSNVIPLFPGLGKKGRKERTLLDSILSKDVLIMPCKGLLKVCAMYLPNLWRSRCCLKEVEGFDHSIVNTTLGACGDLPLTEESPFLPFYVWQCGETKILSETATVLEFDFSKPMSSCSGKTPIEFRESGICHGFVLWIDWVLEAEDNTVLSTGPDKRHWKQAVKLLKKPVKVKEGQFSSTEIEAFFDPSNGEVILQHAFLMNPC